MIGTFSYIDIGLLALCFISGILAMYRGFARELFSIISWIIAGGAVAYFALTQLKFSEDVAKQMGVPTIVATVAIGAIIFLIVLIITHLITSHISDAILDSRVGMIDRILGLGFGVARGFAIIVALFLLGQAFAGIEQYDIVKNSKSLPYVQATAEPVKGLLQRVVDTAKASASAPAAAPDAAPQP
jgi:membrane protein required for colicin V production